ncbi:DegV family protein [Salinibius halmophilus]|uniref:DegV family protein n=1 Tax=Salinibius halmophilus TaxID=1853216 RepID=UPI000E662797|nr:DegV family protein [Salinibius halmophilus]
MTTAIVIDSACDLPHEQLEQPHIELASATIRINGLRFPDKRQPERMQKIYRDGRLELPALASTEPPSVEQFRKIFQQLAEQETEEIYVVSIMRNRSPTLSNAEEAASQLNNELRTPSNKLVHIYPCDSGSMFAGHGLVVMHLQKMLELEDKDHSLSMNQRGRAYIDQTAINARMDFFRRRTENYLVLREPIYMRKRARLKNDHSVTWHYEWLSRLRQRYPIIINHNGDTQAINSQKGYRNAINEVIDICQEAIRNDEIYNSMIAISVADDVAWLRQLEAYVRFKEACQAYGIRLLESVMSLSGGVYLGPGAVSMAFTRKSANRRLTE